MLKMTRENEQLLDVQTHAPPQATVIHDENSMDEPDKNITSADDATNDDHNTDKNTEDEDDDYDDNDDDEHNNSQKNDDSASDESDSESEESDLLDEEESEARRAQYVEDMNDLENQFSDLKDQIYKERIQQIEQQLVEVSQSEAKEYTGPLKQLEDECTIRTEVAGTWNFTRRRQKSGHLKHYRTLNLENKLHCELQAAEQHFQNEENTLIEELTADFEEKLRKVEEERHSVEMYSNLWCDDLFRSRKKRKGMEIQIPEKKKKPVTVTGPFVIYMLNEMDILEDWAAIRKEKGTSQDVDVENQEKGTSQDVNVKNQAKSELARRKAKELSAQEKDPLITACYKDGNFIYQGECFQKGDQVILDNRIDSPVNASITSINTGEIWVSKGDGLKCKLYIAQFQKGKYTITKASVKEETIT